MRGREAKPLGEILEMLRRRGGLRPRKAPREIEAVWADVFGDAADHAVPTSFRGGVLFVEVDSPVWVSELGGFRKADILRRLREMVKTKYVSDIRFRQK